MKERRIVFFAKAVVLVAILSLFGCVSSGPKFTKPEAPPSGQSIVYFYRANNFFTNSTSPAIVHNDKEVLSMMVSGGFWEYNIGPGDHVFKPQQFGIFKKDTLTLTNVKPGETYYVEMVLNIGYIGLQSRSESAGLAGISECYSLNQ